MGGIPFIPRRDAEFDLFLSKYCSIVSRKTSGDNPAWTHIPAAMITELFAVADAWHTAYIKLLEPHTSADVLAKNHARKAAEKILEEFNNQYILYAREVSDPEREEIGAHVHDKVRTTMKKPTCQPEADIVYPGPHLLELVKIRRAPGIGNDPPEADFGVRIFWGILGAPSAKDKFHITASAEAGDDLPHSTFTHRKKFRFDFEGDSGKTVWFCLRYENSKGGKEGEGPFGIPRRSVSEVTEADSTSVFPRLFPGPGLSRRDSQVKFSRISGNVYKKIDNTQNKQDKLYRFP